MAYTYILYSNSLDRFYIGSTGESLEERFRRHLTSHKGFTSKAKDWIIVYSEQYQDIKEAHQREMQIKKWKSKRMIQHLISSK